MLTGIVFLKRHRAKQEELKSARATFKEQPYIVHYQISDKISHISEVDDKITTYKLKDITGFKQTKNLIVLDTVNNTFIPLKS